METTEKQNKKKTEWFGFQVLENECIWMKAGVINFRLCDNAYDCTTCPFDKGMQKTMKTKQDISEGTDWALNLKKQYKNDERPCRHVLTGRIAPPKTCPNNYECNHCSYDQWLDEIDPFQHEIQRSYPTASGYQVADDYYYHAGHTWACFEHGGFTKVGFDDFLVKLFGRMDSVRLPELGKELKQNQIGWGFTRENKEAWVLSPVSGKVLAVNHKVLNHTDIIHHDPYHDGWLFIMEPDMARKNIKKLYHGTESLKWMETEVQRLLKLMGPEYEQLAATGGTPIDDIYGTMPELEWGTLVKHFLKT